jgi:hypothetical protein
MKSKQIADIPQPSPATALPSRSLELEYVYAFKGKDSRANILSFREQETITFVGPLGIVHCLASNSQVLGRVHLLHFGDFNVTRLSRAALLSRARCGNQMHCRCAACTLLQPFLPAFPACIPANTD